MENVKNEMENEINKKMFECGSVFEVSPLAIIKKTINSKIIEIRDFFKKQINKEEFDEYYKMYLERRYYKEISSENELLFVIDDGIQFEFFKCEKEEDKFKVLYIFDNNERLELFIEKMKKNEKFKQINKNNFQSDYINIKVLRNNSELDGNRAEIIFFDFYNNVLGKENNYKKLINNLESIISSEFSDIYISINKENVLFLNENFNYFKGVKNGK